MSQDPFSPRRLTANRASVALSRPGDLRDARHGRKAQHLAASSLAFPVKHDIVLGRQGEAPLIRAHLIEFAISRMLLVGLAEFTHM